MTMPLGTPVGDLGRTVRMEAPAVEAAVPAAAAPAAAPRIPRAGAPGLRLSRRFDSTEALRRLARMTGGEDLLRTSMRTVKLDLRALHEAPPSLPRRARRERPAPPARTRRDRWILVASVTIAALVAVAIALG
jgi:hypothetical protein